MAQTQTETAVMAQTAAKFEQVNQQLQSLLSTLMSELSVLNSTWKGMGAAAFENVKQQYAADLKNEFEMLYTEAEGRRRMMSISAHDRIAGRPARAKVLEEFIIHAQRRPGVVFMRKDEIAKFALASSITPQQEEAHDADAA